MDLDNIFWLAFQSSLILGLVHGINPCGHSWLVLAPFVVGEKRGAKVAFLTFMFLFGTAAACLLLGFTLGAVSTAIPPAFEEVVDIGTSALLILLGVILVVKPKLLHHHDHDHDHGHHDHHDSDTSCEGHSCGFRGSRRHKVTGWALLGIGFVNMVIPCPTVAIMYGYALDSGHYLKSTAVFAVYAFGTAVAVGGVIYAIHKVTRLLKTFSQDWVESAVMRTAGVLTIVFAVYTLMQHH